MSIEDKVRDLIAEQLGKDRAEVGLEKTFLGDLQADSLDIVELVMTLESEFEIDIPDEDAERIRTVQDAVDYIQRNSI